MWRDGEKFVHKKREKIAPQRKMQLRKTNQLAIPDLPSKVTVRSLLDAFSKFEKKM